MQDFQEAQLSAEQEQAADRAKIDTILAKPGIREALSNFKRDIFDQTEGDSLLFDDETGGIGITPDGLIIAGRVRRDRREEDDFMTVWVGDATQPPESIRDSLFSVELPAKAHEKANRNERSPIEVPSEFYMTTLEFEQDYEYSQTPDSEREAQFPPNDQKIVQFVRRLGGRYVHIPNREHSPHLLPSIRSQANNAEPKPPISLYPIKDL
ncbi:MAG TPA: hypothetical protein VLF93_02500 [Candidatus Saccharimonadales bacterium]|nr:hypothetical protein [Candidatus Saccharimonadales bacterium]